MHNRAAGLHDYGRVATSTAIETQDAILHDLGMVEWAPLPEPARVRVGEHRLAVALLTGAIEEAVAPKPELAGKLNGWARRRSNARDWLRLQQPCMSARACCEALGIEYEAMMRRLEERWAREI